MISKIIKYFKKFLQKNQDKKEVDKKLKQAKKNDPFIYK